MGHEEPRKALSYKAGYVVAIESVISCVPGAFPEIPACKACHSCPHPLADVSNDATVHNREPKENRIDVEKVLEQGGLVALADAAHLEAAVVEIEIEITQMAEFLVLLAGECLHVILHSVEPAKDEVEDSDARPQVGGQLLDDHGEGPAHLDEHVVTKALQGKGAERNVNNDEPSCQAAQLPRQTRTEQSQHSPHSRQHLLVG